MVQPRAPRGDAEARERELAARKRVAALVSGGLNFHLKRNGDQVQAARGTGGAKLCARLTNKTFVPEQTLDLAGTPESEFDGAISAFLRVVHRRGVKHLLIAFSNPADESREQREESLVTALTRGGPAPLVRAFATPHDAFGGRNALAVLLV